MTTEVVVSSVAVGPDGIELSYLVLPEDVRCEGQVVLTRSAAIAYTSPAGLGAAARDLQTAVEALARQLHDTPADQLPVFEPPKTEDVASRPLDVDDDDEDVGMGDGR
jgi:hypothetical protein